MNLHEIIEHYPWLKLAVVAGLVAISVVVEIVVHAYLNISVAYTHVFYLVIVIAGIWYYKKAVLLALFLGVLHIAVDYFLTGVVFDPAALVRAAMFVVVAYVVGWLSESKDRYFIERERKHRALIGFVTEVALRIKTPVGVIRENLDDICHSIDAGEMSMEEVHLALQVQSTHAEKILATLRELNQGVVDEQQDIPDSYADLLVR